MPSTYSEDFRRSIVRFVECGHSRRETARVYGTSASFVINLMRRYKSTGLISAFARGGVRHAKLTPYRDEIISWLEARPDMTLEEIAARLADRHDVSASTSGLSDMLRKAGYTYKKIAVGQRGHTRKTPPKA